MKYSILCILLIAGICGFAQAQPIKRLDGTTVSVTEIDQAVERLMDEAKVQGFCVAILNENRTVFTKAYGYRNKPKNERLDTATIMYGASLSKAVFGYLTLLLVKEKVIDLDKPLYRYLRKPIADYAYFADLKNDERWKKITARMCLSHTTGLPNVRWINPLTSEEDTAGVMKIYFTPGTKYAYSGEGFKLLQLAIEEITGKTIEELAQTRIFVPLGMTRTGYIWHESFGDDNVAVGHLNNGAIDIKRKRTEGVAGGSLVTTIADYSRFIENIMQQKGLDRKGYLELTRPQIRIRSVAQFPTLSYETTTENDAIQLSYGLGWGVFRCKGGRVSFKEGNGGSWRNYNVNFIDKGISIIFLSNSENGEALFRPFIEQFAGKTCIPWKWEGFH